MKLQLIEHGLVRTSESHPAAPVRAVLLAIEPDGRLKVQAGHEVWHCDWLEGTAATALVAGDRLIVLPPGGGQLGVVIGRIGRYNPPQRQANLTLEATESLTLKCGDASVDLRADGKVMVRGDDVLIRAKGTQRIRAGNVAIN